MNSSACYVAGKYKMLEGNEAIFLNLMSVAITAFVIVTILISAIIPLIKNNLNSFGFIARKRTLWLLATAPWWIALCCVVIFFPRQDTNNLIALMEKIAHWHHIDVFKFTSWHGLTLVVAALILAVMINLMFVQVRRHSIAMHNLFKFSDVQPISCDNNQTIYSIALSIPAAFTIGLLKPRVYLTTGLLQQLEPSALDIIIQHELAHVRARDPLFKSIYSFFCLLYPKPIRRILQQHFTLLTEQQADSVVTGYHDNLDVAQTLISVAKKQRQFPQNCEGSLVSHFSHDQITLRVQKLLSPQSQISELTLVFTGLCFLTAMLFTVLLVDGLHHLIETYFIH
ncbi:M56 family metallopeptidase [Shewanella frigidimarina]|uniref:M56 family metallopeptidase n=1 Tax=Shewanella frigidimarina TaxID=56812 RepID=UPI003F9FEA71